MITARARYLCASMARFYISPRHLLPRGIDIFAFARDGDRYVLVIFIVFRYGILEIALLIVKSNVI